MEIAFSPSFVRLFKTLPADLQEEVIEKTEAFRHPSNHKALKVHKLSGRLKGRYAFSVDYRTRIVFSYSNAKPKEAYFLAVGDHEVYK